MDDVTSPRGDRRLMAGNDGGPSSIARAQLSCALLFTALAFAKTPDLFTDPRFYAEEATHYWTALYGRPLLDALLHTHIGSFQILSNLAVLAATHAPLEYAPFVTTFAALALHLVVAAQIGRFVVAWRMSHGVGVALVVAWAFLPATYEVWLTATNLQWITGVSALLIFALPARHLNGIAWRASAWAAICGLSGIPATMTAPFFLLRGLISRSVGHLTVGCVLSAGAALQLAVLATHGAPGRDFATDPLVLLLPTLLQTVLAPLVGATTVQDWLVELARPVTPPEMLMAGVITLCLAGVTVMALILHLNRASAEPSLAPMILALLWLVSLIQTFGALWSPILLVSGFAHARYFLFGSMCICLMLALATTSSEAIARRTAVAGLAIICAIGIWEWRTALWQQSYIDRAPWTTQLAHCDRREAYCVIFVSPFDGAWRFDIPTARLRLGPTQKAGPD